MHIIITLGITLMYMLMRPLTLIPCAAFLTLPPRFKLRAAALSPKFAHPNDRVSSSAIAAHRPVTYTCLKVTIPSPTHAVNLSLYFTNRSEQTLIFWNHSHARTHWTVKIPHPLGMGSCDRLCFHGHYGLPEWRRPLLVLSNGASELVAETM